MRSFAPCLVVILAGLALGVAGAFAWITGEAYKPDRATAYTPVALIPVVPVRRSLIHVGFSTGRVMTAVIDRPRGGHAT